MARNNKIWKIRGVDETFSDEELVELIKQGRLLGGHYISTKEMKVWITVADSIYQYYLKENKNDETI